MLDEDFQMEQVEENRGRADENVRQVRRVDLAEIAWKKAILPGTTVNNRCLLKAIPGLHTLAISSLFLSSPSTVMTFPFPSTSVHRRRGSSAAFAVRDLRWKMDPDSSSSLTLMSPSFSGSPSFFWSGPKIHSCHVNLLPSSLGVCSEEAYRRAPPAGVNSWILVAAAAVRCLVVRAFGRIALRPKMAACRVGSRRVTGGFDAFSDGLVRLQAHAWRRVDERREADSAKLRPSD